MRRIDGRGFLISEVKPAEDYPEDDMRSWDERWKAANVKAIRALTELAETKGASVTQLALAWLLAQGEDIQAELKRLGEILPNGAYGARYPAAHMPSW